MLRLILWVDGWLSRLLGRKPLRVVRIQGRKVLMR